MNASYHAIQRYQERAGIKDFATAKKEVLELAHKAIPAFGYKRNGKIRLFPKEHFITPCKWVFVIKNNKILTCFQADTEQCIPIKT